MSDSNTCENENNNNKEQLNNKKSNIRNNIQNSISEKFKNSFHLYFEKICEKGLTNNSESSNENHNSNHSSRNVENKIGKTKMASNNILVGLNVESDNKSINNKNEDKNDNLLLKESDISKSQSNNNLLCSSNSNFNVHSSIDNNYFYINIKDSDLSNNTHENINKSININPNLDKENNEMIKVDDLNNRLISKIPEDIENENNLSYQNLTAIKQYLLNYTLLSKTPLNEIIQQKEFKDAEFVTKGITESRIQNMAITIDKINHVLGLYKEKKPPLILLDIKEIIENLWIHEYSLRCSLLNNIKNLRKILINKRLMYNIDELDLILNILRNEFFDISQYDGVFASYKNEYIQNLVKILSCFIFDKLKKNEENYALNPALFHHDYINYIEQINSFNNKYAFSFKEFLLQSFNKKNIVSDNNDGNNNNNLITQSAEKIFLDMNIKKDDSYWINTDYIIQNNSSNNNQLINKINEDGKNTIQNNLEEGVFSPNKRESEIFSEKTMNVKDLVEIKETFGVKIDLAISENNSEQSKNTKKNNTLLLNNCSHLNISTNTYNKERNFKYNTKPYFVSLKNNNKKPIFEIQDIHRNVLSDNNEIADPIDIERKKNYTEDIKMDFTCNEASDNYSSKDYKNDRTYTSILSSKLKLMSNEEAAKILIKIRECLKFISLVFKICDLKEGLYANSSKTFEKEYNNSPSDTKPDKLVFYQGLSDMIYLHSCIEFYFRNNKAYDKQVNSCEIFIRERDVNIAANEENNKNLDSNIYSGQKKYDRMYIWGQLVGWFKQTVLTLNIF